MYRFLLSAASIVLFAGTAAAQDAAETITFADEVVDDTTITVTATGTRIEVEDTGQAVTVLGETEIASVQGPDLTRVLERVPGLSFSRNGGLGGFTGVRLRGAEAEQLLVVIDGVRAADPAAPSGGFDFGNLTTANLSKIDVLRGSNSTIWGSDAVGGVLVASTRAASGLAGSLEYGGDDTFSGAVSGGLSDNDVGFVGASASYVATDGFSAAADGSEPDGFEQWVLEGHARGYISDTFELFARARYAKGELEYDGFPFPLYQLADTREVQDTRQFFGSAGAVYDSGPLFVTASYARADTARDNYDRDLGADPTFSSEGTSDTLGLRGEWRPIGPLLVNFGAQQEWTAYETLFDEGAETAIFGAYAQAGVEWRGLSAHLGARVDDHRQFGSEVSFGGDVSYEVAPQWRVRASVGEGFKAPTLFQLLSDFGNPLLTPERSLSMDAGLSFADRSQPLYGAVTVFRRRTRDQIAFVGCFGSTDPICTDRLFGTYDNVARASAQGVEAELGARLANTLRLGLAAAFVDTEDRDTGLALARRPRTTATLTAEWTPLPALELGADLRIVSASFDDAANTVRLNAYEVLTLRAAFDVTDRVQIHGRVENVWDEDYQTAAGYATRGRAVFVGARLAL